MFAAIRGAAQPPRRAILLWFIALKPHKKETSTGRPYDLALAPHDAAALLTPALTATRVEHGRVLGDRGLLRQCGVLGLATRAPRALPRAPHRGARARARANARRQVELERRRPRHRARVELTPRRRRVVRRQKQRVVDTVSAARSSSRLARRELRLACRTAELEHLTRAATSSSSATALATARASSSRRAAVVSSSAERSSE